MLNNQFVILMQIKQQQQQLLQHQLHSHLRSRQQLQILMRQRHSQLHTLRHQLHFQPVNFISCVLSSTLSIYSDNNELNKIGDYIDLSDSCVLT